MRKLLLGKKSWNHYPIIVVILIDWKVYANVKYYVIEITEKFCPIIVVTFRVWNVQVNVKEILLVSSSSPIIGVTCSVCKVHGNVEKKTITESCG